eukprot:6256149-Alexandrium_andersonii.AAC.1
MNHEGFNESGWLANDCATQALSLDSGPRLVDAPAPSQRHLRGLHAGHGILPDEDPRTAGAKVPGEVQEAHR